MMEEERRGTAVSRREKRRTGKLEKTRELVCSTAVGDAEEEVRRYPVVRWPTTNFGISSNNREDRRNSGYPRDMLYARLLVR